MKNKQHWLTIKRHRKYVRHWCFRCGLIWQGLTHDLSKYSHVEKEIAKWANGSRSPHDIARDELGYSPSWYHHKNCNKHHWEYWLDFNKGHYENGKFVIEPVAVKMPFKYVVEMFCDFVGAGMAYNPGNWNASMPLEYHNKYCSNKLYHHETLKLFVVLLVMLKEQGDEHKFIQWYNKEKKILKQAYEGGYL